MLCTRGFSVCCETASSDSSSGSPARTRVASCRVNSARSAADTRRAKLNERWRFASFCATSATVTGSSCCSRSSWRMCRGVSPSRIPLRSLPAASSAVYSNAPIFKLAESRLRRFQPSILARDAQHFLDGRLATQHACSAIVADRRCAETGVTLDLLLGYPIVDHGAHGVIDDDQLVDSGSAAVAAGAVTSRTIERRRGLIGSQ